MEALRKTEHHIGLVPEVTHDLSRKLLQRLDAALVKRDLDTKDKSQQAAIFLAIAYFLTIIGPQLHSAYESEISIFLINVILPSISTISGGLSLYKFGNYWESTNTKKMLQNAEIALATGHMQEPLVLEYQDRLAPLSDDQIAFFNLLHHLPVTGHKDKKGLLVESVLDKMYDDPRYVRVETKPFSEFPQARPSAALLEETERLGLNNIKVLDHITGRLFGSRKLPTLSAKNALSISLHPRTKPSRILAKAGVKHSEVTSLQMCNSTLFFTDGDDHTSIAKSKEPEARLSVIANPTYMVVEHEITNIHSLNTTKYPKPLNNIVIFYDPKIYGEPPFVNTPPITRLVDKV